MQIGEKQTPEDLHLIKSRTSHSEASLPCREALPIKISLTFPGDRTLDQGKYAIHQKPYIAVKEIHQNHQEWKVVSQCQLLNFKRNFQGGD